MDQVSVVRLDLAKSVFQVHGVNAQGEAVLRRRLTRSQLLQMFEKQLGEAEPREWHQGQPYKPRK